MDGVLIVGGYGHVGQKIAARLLANGVNNVYLAGRNARRAHDVAARIGAHGVVVDVADAATWDHALDGIGTVVVCIDQTGNAFPAEVLRRGLSYVDISATDAVLRGIEALDEVARQNDGCAVLSVGLAPGLSNLMVCAISAGASHVTIGVLLGLGDDHGAAAIDWTLDTLQQRGGVEPYAFGIPHQYVPTIPFDFADQHSLARRHGIVAQTRLGLASPVMTANMLRLMVALAPKPWFRAVIRWSMRHLRLGSDRAALAVEAHGNGTYRRITLEGRAEADITALVTAQVVLMLPSRRRSGVWHIQDLWTLDDFTAPLRNENSVMSVEL